MKNLTFKGGIHPGYHKEATERLAIATLPLSAEFILPLSQHIGAPAIVAVKEGDTVVRGQIIADTGGFVSAPIHAPVSGTVKAIEARPAGNGYQATAIVLVNDGLDTSIEWSGAGEFWNDLDREKLKDMIAEAGIVGLGGAAFPSGVKLSPPADKPIDTVIINGAECEPWLTADHRVMLESPEDVVTGLKIMLKVLGAKTGLIGIEANKPDAITAMKKAVEGTEIRVISLAVKYPQGGEKQLIDACLRRRVPTGKLPMDVGVVVHNAGTARAICNAVVRGIPLMERVVTITGTGVARPGNFEIRIGTPVSDVLEHCGVSLKPGGKLILGGPMMGVAQKTAEAPVIKSTSGILVMDPATVSTAPARPCIRCGRCVAACPMNLVPSEIAAFSRSRMYAEAETASVLDCMECGSCAHECPSRIPLVQFIRLAKSEIAAAKRKKK